MLTVTRIPEPHTARQRSVSHARSGGRWRLRIALLTVIAFFLLLVTAAAHHHKSSIEDSECAMCSAVAHTISGAPSAKLIEHLEFLLPYKIFAIAMQCVAYPPPVLLPPSRGPPALPQAFPQA